MAKQRLIDGNELYGTESLLNTDIIRNSKEASWLMSQVLYDIQSTPTIDPETLPIVRQLREELERVTEERDAAISDIETAMASESTQNILYYLCSLCQNKDLNRGCTCDGKCSPKWRGAQKEE